MLHDQDFINVVRMRRRVFAGLLAVTVIASVAMGVKKIYFSPLDIPRHQTYAEMLQSYKRASVQTKNGSTELLLEIADTDDKRSMGLMFRRTLARNSGMIFIFKKETQNPFWMKNTKLPLDILFIGTDKRIVDFLPMNPCTQDPCTMYYSSKPYKYAIEVNQGWTAEHKIAIGDVVYFD